MAYPKIVYRPEGASVDVTLELTYPAVQKSGTSDLSAERQDSITISGLKQSINQRIDILLPLQFDYIPMEDLPDWEEFMRHALTGAEFDYFPDRSLMVFTTYTCEDKKWQPKFNFKGMAKFTLNLREAVSDSSS